jgi:hypothetical protein
VGYKQGYPLIHSPYYDDDPILIQKRWAETMDRNDGQQLRTADTRTFHQHRRQQVRIGGGPFVRRIKRQ